LKKAAFLGLNLVIDDPILTRRNATMQEVSTTALSFPSTNSRDALTEVLRSGAQRLLAEAIEAEVREWIDSHAQVIDAAGRRQVVRNGRLPKRSILTGIGPVQVEQPRVLDRRGEEGETFSSKILPPYLRKTRSLEELIPWLYLKGVSTGDFGEALGALVGPGAEGLSASTITRLKAVWEEEFKEWTNRSLQGKQYVYVWADGVHFNVRLEEDRQCILVLMGATPEGKKELIAVVDGYRESEQSWKELLLDVKARGLPSIPSSPRATEPWASGRRLTRSGPRPALSGAGSTRRPTCWTSCPSGFSRERRTPCIRSGWPRPRRTPRRRSTCF
jgi:transposase-like protein